MHDQLDDLTELLKTALHDEEEHADLMYDIVDTKNPGKINKQVINSLQHKMEESAKKVSNIGLSKLVLREISDRLL